MKSAKRYYRAGMLLLLGGIISSSVVAQSWLKPYLETTSPGEQLNFYDIQTWADDHFKQVEQEIKIKQANGERIEEGMGQQYAHYIKYKRWEWYWQSRILEDGAMGHIESKTSTQHTANKKAASKTTANYWESIGFTSADGGYWGMGRAECMGFHPTDPNTFYVGSHGGGVWKTTNGGQSYTSIGDDLPITVVGNIQVDHQNPDIIYITLGHRGGWWHRSMGVYKSTDGGDTWNPTSYNSEYADGAVLDDMLMSPVNSSILLLGSRDGLWRTTDGGDNWTEVATGEWTDLDWRPGDGNTVYAVKYDYWGETQIYKSTDAGVNWTQITNKTVTNNTIKIATTPANPNFLAYYSSNENKAIYVSYDNGNNFEFRSNMEHDMWPLYVSPIDQNTIYNGGIHLSRSLNAGSSFDQITQWYYDGVYDEVHADFRNAYAAPAEQGISYFCNDGGVYRYDENTTEWTELNNTLAITQYYRVACAQSDVDVVACGSQDNGGSMRTSNGSWKNTNGGDAMEQAIDPNDADILYTTYINGQLYRSMDGWSWDTYNDISENIPGGKPDGNWVTPYKLDPNNSQTLIAAYNEVWKTTNRGDSWTAISSNLSGGENLDAIAIAPSNSNYIYTANGSTVYVTSNGGQNWNSATAFTGGTVTQIAVAHDDPTHVWVTRDGWNAGEKVFESTNGGASWTNISGSLPNVPTNSIIAENSTNHGLYLGNDVGVYYLSDDLSDWENYSVGLPNVVVNDLDIQYSGGKLRAATWGRGVWEIDLYNPDNVLREDCAGVLEGTAAKDSCGVCSGGTTGIEPNSTCCNMDGVIDVEKWSGVTGTLLSDNDFTSAPDVIFQSDDFDHNFEQWEDDFASRVTALLCPPATGEYTFWFASDDEGTLSLSTDQYADNSRQIANVPDWCPYQNFEKYASQQSETISLVAGQKYFIEVLMKEGGGGAHFSVAWTGPNITTRTIISAAQLVQETDCNGDIGGRAYQDSCETCVGGNTGLEPCQMDCMDEWGGSAFVDSCGVCAGGNTGIDPITDPSGCIITGVVQTGSDLYHLYPNPVQDLVHLRQTGAVAFELYSPVGQLILQGAVQQQTIDLSGVPAGLYLMRVTGARGTSISTLQVQ